MKKLFELEHLVNTGGNQEAIDKLRIELGMIPDPAKKKYKPRVKFVDTFNVEGYIQMKKDKLPDREIADLLGVSMSSLQVAKKTHGVVLKPRGNDKGIFKTRRQMIMNKLETQDRVKSELALEIINQQDATIKELREKLAEAQKKFNKELQIMKSRKDRANEQKNKALEKLYGLKQGVAQ